MRLRRLKVLLSFPGAVLVEGKTAKWGVRVFRVGDMCQAWDFLNILFISWARS